MIFAFSETHFNPQLEERPLLLVFGQDSSIHVGVKWLILRLVTFSSRPLSFWSRKRIENTIPFKIKHTYVLNEFLTTILSTKNIFGKL